MLYSPENRLSWLRYDLVAGHCCVKENHLVLAGGGCVLCDWIYLYHYSNYSCQALSCLPHLQKFFWFFRKTKETASTEAAFFVMVDYFLSCSQGETIYPVNRSDAAIAHFHLDIREWHPNQVVQRDDLPETVLLYPADHVFCREFDSWMRPKLPQSLAVLYFFVKL